MRRRMHVLRSVGMAMKSRGSRYLDGRGTSTPSGVRRRAARCLMMLGSSSSGFAITDDLHRTRVHVIGGLVDGTIASKMVVI